MEPVIWAAIIGLIGAISVPFISKYLATHGNNTKVKDIMILSPKADSIITKTSNEKKPIERQISGRVNGFTKNEILTLGLKVAIRIKTDEWYEQKTLTNDDITVDSDGHWVFPNARFGGKAHVIEATLKDKYGREYNSATIEVTVRQ
ncbi:hypothetical protein QUF90_08365 [Desulfococcaceae bacterium HSG9]|nr:hypothetical protein [Desulfococcaceae bacterium HSG9]